MVDIVCVIDKSGSMWDLRTDTVGNFNQFLDEQQQLPGKAKLTLVLFNHNYMVVHDRTKLKKVEPLTAETYHPDGTTALLDAVGKTIEDLGDKKKVIFMIITDGYENSSKDYTKDRVKKLIKDREDRGWEFRYLGVGVNNFDDAMSMGVAAANTFSFDYSAKGMAATYSEVSGSATRYRASNV